ncbi:MAG: hypothetical protein EZS28_046727 [Streblomastix strix]|uniref:Uncharacterized protein n=1 Tax=Streblomastix strix TaxID=222440 RepID=A0A5J4TGY1_9EUKA|nr:MAG: hypothetical protein EZS28_046727 [Streblomastix strix]
MYYLVVYTVIKVYDSLGNDMVGGNSFVIHRENIAGKSQIHKFRLQDDQATKQLKASPEFLWFMYEFRIASTNSIYKSQDVHARRSQIYHS